MKQGFQRQSCKAYTIVFFWGAFISIFVLSGITCTAKKADKTAPASDNQVPTEMSGEGAVEPAQPTRQSHGTTTVTRSAPTKQPKDSIDISSDVKSIEGIAWQGDYLWVLDDERKIIDRFDTTLEELSPDPKYSIDLAQPSGGGLKKFKGMAFDKGAEVLWVAAEETNINTKKMVPLLIMIDPTKGQTIKTVEMDTPADKGFISVEGITWDGKYLLVAIYAGFSSSFNWIDPMTGKIKRSIFADCNPRGIATDGDYLWSICYNKKRFPSRIDQRKIEDEEHEMLRSREFIKDLPEAESIGLVFNGTDLWYADKIAEKVNRVILPFTKQKPVVPPVKTK
ncbi:MAG: hypothetical protein AYP45_07025 [Candidatus Brocadia carolinensis]|uniref:SMP-30/Gluconolactonase/LRE-like region domain-containing protein n=1 Tax=Candidatus Brocadia carolinensis TaxID=1004156 RepID=A0A1V4AUF9_9BACT|nr:MAG: hypothetical protein AYP45_07025 [Candidatus Brocadia caroliniensis]